jgi:uncharacterized protein GlcG (DUF336 family)
MKPAYEGLLLTMALALLAGPAAAAQGLISERTLSLDVALELASAAMEACRKHGSRVTITVLDHAGRTKVQLREDGSNPHSVEHSIRKAYTALTHRMPSGEYGKRTAGQFPNSFGVLSLPNITTAAGGLPIRAGDTVVGAIGISGTPGARGAGSGGGGAADEACAQVGLDRIAKWLGG